MVKREDLYGIAYYKKSAYYGSAKPDIRFRIALDMEKGKKGLALFHTTEKMTDRSGMVSADRLYAAAADFAQSLAGQVFTPVQVGNIKYKEPVGSGEQLVLKGKIALMKVNRKYIYISFFKRAAEVFRAKFIMEVSKTGGEALHG